mgnify:CR=1 FL=1
MVRLSLLPKTAMATPVVVVVVLLLRLLSTGHRWEAQLLQRVHLHAPTARGQVL